MGKNDQMNALACVDQYLTEIRQVKSAALKKKATDPSDPTTQPVMKADDGTVKATTGSRAAENDSDIKKDYGDAGNTGQEDAHSASSEHPSDSIGTMKMDADQTKGNVQTPKSTLSKPTKNDGGVESPSHPSNATFSEKYSKLMAKGQNFLQKIAEMPEQFKKGKKKEEKPVAPVQAPVAKGPEGDEKKLAAAKYPDEAEAGYVAAALLAQELGFVEKQAATDPAKLQKEAEANAENLVKYAFTLADDYCDFLDGLEKKADEMGAGGPPQMIPPEVMAADQAGAGGGMPPGAGMPPGDGMPPGGPGPEGPGGAGPGGDEAIIEQLAQALEEAGITPEQLAEAVAAEEAGGGGGGGGMGAGGPPMGGGGEAPPPAAPEQGEEEAASGAKEENAGSGPEKSEKSEKKEATAKPVLKKK